MYDDEQGMRWADYLASGHQVSHARVELWSRHPSAHLSAHIMAEYHVQAIR